MVSHGASQCLVVDVLLRVDLHLATGLDLPGTSSHIVSTQPFLVDQWVAGSPHGFCSPGRSQEIHGWQLSGP